MFFVCLLSCLIIIVPQGFGVSTGTEKVKNNELTFHVGAASGEGDLSNKVIIKSEVSEGESKKNNGWKFCRSLLIH